MRYVIARYKNEQKALAYRIYITDALYYYGENKRLGVRYQDIITPKKMDNRSGDEIALDVINKLGLKVKQDECI